MHAIARDIRVAARRLVRSPGFAIAAALTFALGIGANTALFSVVDAVLLRPLPYPEPDRIVRVYETAPRTGDTRSIAMPTLLDWRPGLRSLSGLAAFSPWTFDVSGAGRPEQLAGAAVSQDFFQVMGIEPALGRAFLPGEQQPGGGRVVVLSHGLWRRRFAGDRGILGGTIRLDGEPYTIVGIMPPGFGYPDRAELWAPLSIDHEFDRRDARHLSVIGRMTRGGTTGEVASELMLAESRLADRFPGTYTGFGVKVISLHERMVGGVRPALLLLLGAVTLVLLIACANVANLILARAVRRQRELALRTALGASRARIARELVIESVLLAVSGGAIGVLAAAWALDLLRALSPGDIPRLDQVGLDPRVLAYSALAIIGAGLAAGLLPLIGAGRPDVHALLKDAARATGGSRHHRLRGALVVGQTALALVLLAGAGLLIRSFDRLSRVSLGLNPTGVLTFNLGLPPAADGKDEYAVNFFADLQRRLASVPGVEAVGMASRLPLSGADHSSGFLLPGEVPEPGRGRSAQDRAVTPGYFATLQIPILRGRDFTAADRRGGAPVVIINDAFARRYFHGLNPVGRQFTPGRAGNVAREIVGVVGDTPQGGADVAPEPEYYLPHSQDAWPWLRVVLRTRGDPLALVPSLERTVWSVAPDMPLTDVTTMDRMQSQSVAQRRFSTALLSALAAIALALACLGIYSVMSYIVAERTPEVGIRMALGARAGQVQALVMARGLRLMVGGLVIGLVAAWVALRLLQASLATLLFRTQAGDGLTLTLVVLILAGIGVMASWIPARRAARVPPMSALRAE